MGIRLKSRLSSPPNGFYFRQAETGWELTTWDFQQLCNELQKHRRANPQYRLQLDMASIQDEVDVVNAARVSTIPNAEGFLQQGDLAPPKPMPQRNLGQSLRSVAAGGRTIIEWIKSGAEAVAPELANKRASICAECPKNAPGDWTAFFTVPVSKAIQFELEKRKEMDLKTDYDDKLRVCSACLCPLPLKVHMGIDAIMKRLPEESKSELVPECWILEESKSL
jgi:hypothetical protein